MSYNPNKVRTGIPGLDSLLSGGLREGRSLVVSGPPGSGKTTFGLQFLYNGARDFGEPGVFISLSQNLEELREDCKSFGWDVDDLIQNQQILMVDARPFKIKNDLIGKDDSLFRGEGLPFEHFTKLILSSIKRINAKRLVVDSLSVLQMQYEDSFYARQGLQGMIQALENYGVTSMLVSESVDDEISMEWFVVSGVLKLDNVRKHDTTERTLQVMKLRGINHSKQIHLVEIGDDGLQIVHPRINP